MDYGINAIQATMWANLGRLLVEGMSLIETLDQMAAVMPDQHLREALEDMANEVRTGGRPSRALFRRTNLFPEKLAERLAEAEAEGTFAEACEEFGRSGPQGRIEMSLSTGSSVHPVMEPPREERRPAPQRESASPARARSGSGPRPVTVRCDFCHRPAGDLGKVFSGPPDDEGGVSYICEDCVRACADQIG